jgi:hypothetical protein
MSATSVVVFAGPTISHREAAGVLDAVYLPPASQGDVYRAARERPFAIALIDGYFDLVPAVWHKEILWAMTQGVHVFGASSMGALRAAELAGYGMKGVGRIFEALRTGELDDDDEVAVVHEDERTGYRACSEAMVNVRATLSAAVAARALTAEVRDALIALGKRLFYPDRSYGRILEAGAAEGVSSDELARLAEFLKTGRVDQKRADALELLALVERCAGEGAPAPAPRFSFARTDRWERLVEWAESQPPLRARPDSTLDALVAAEARLDRDASALVAGALSRAAASEVARARRARPVLRDRRSAEEVPSPFDENGLSETARRRLLERDADLAWLRDRLAPDLDGFLVDEARMTGRYGRLAAAARAKQELLARHGVAEPALEDAAVCFDELVVWYFEACLGRPAPRSLEGYLTEAGLPDIPTFQREAVRAFLYAKLLREPVGVTHGTSP